MKVLDRSARAIILVATAALAFSGCSDAPDASGPAVAPSRRAAGQHVEDSSPQASTSAAALRPSMQVVDEHRFQEILAANRGKVVLADFWATWCIECLELMPHTVKLHDALGEQGLATLFVCFDSPDDRQRVEEVLAEKGVRFESYISKYGADVKSAEAFQIEGATLPHVKLYDRSGTLRKVFSTGRMPPEPFGPEDIEKAVRQILAE